MENIKTDYAEERWSYWFTTIAINTGLVLSVLAWFHFCTTDCEASHNYKFLGLPIELFGVIFFGILAYLNTKAYRNKDLVGWIGLLLLSGLGAEIWLIAIQKYQIGHWCPVCLSIFCCILVAFLSYGRAYRNIEKKLAEDDMKKIKSRLNGFIAIGLGFLITFIGVGKVDQIHAAEETIKKELFFGKASSPIEVYIFTDWFCPACRAVEPAIEKMAPDIMKDAKLVFVDYMIHPESLNFTPYNLSFLINNKDKYFQLRNALLKIAEKTQTPTEEQVEKAATKIGVTYHQLNYADVKLGMEWFEQLGKDFNIHKTPSIAIVNRSNKKGIKLQGSDEITWTKVQNAIDSLKK